MLVVIASVQEKQQQTTNFGLHEQPHFSRLCTIHW